MTGTVFLDSNVFVLARAAEAPARAVLAAVQAGDLPARTSTSVIEELHHLELRGRIRGLDGIAAHVAHALAPLLVVETGTVYRALAFGATGMGANDRVIAATCFEHLIDTIVTADQDFDEMTLLRRVDPRDSAAVTALLAG